MTRALWITYGFAWVCSEGLRAQVIPVIVYYPPAPVVTVAPPTPALAVVPSGALSAATPRAASYWNPVAPTLPRQRVERYFIHKNKAAKSQPQTREYLPPKGGSAKSTHRSRYPESARNNHPDVGITEDSATVVVREFHYYDDDEAETEDSSTDDPAESDSADRSGRDDRDKSGSAPARKMEPLPPLGPLDEPLVSPPKPTTDGKPPSPKKTATDSTDSSDGDVSKKKSEEPNAPPAHSSQYPPTAEQTFTVKGMFLSARGSGPLANTRLAFFHRDGLHLDRILETDEQGKFTVRLEAGHWLVFFVYPDQGGRRLLKTLRVDSDVKSDVKLEG